MDEKNEKDETFCLREFFDAEDRRSPDLFCDEHDQYDENDDAEPVKRLHAYYENACKKLEKTLSGVPPPPSVTISQMSASEMIRLYNANLAAYEAADVQRNGTRNANRWLADERAKSLADCGTWPRMMLSKHFGVQYNCAPASENADRLTSRFQSRFVGCETASSCVAAVSACRSPLKRSLRRNPARSPEKRLSHLARRRIVPFNASSLREAPFGRRQILIDRRRLNGNAAKRPTPKKGTPRKKTPKKNTPKKFTPKKSASKITPRRSARKDTPERARPADGATIAPRTKRALFFSPAKGATSGEQGAGCSAPCGDAKRIKLDASDACDSSQRIRLQKSYSFGDNKAAQSFQEYKQPLTRYTSETFPKRPGELSAHHKKKLLWAVSVALKEREVNSAHQDFRRIFSTLARLTQKLSQLPYNVKLLSTPGNCTSDTFLKIARQHAYAILRNTSLEDIFKEERLKQMVMHSSRNTGYIPLNISEISNRSSQFSIENCENSSETKEASKGNSCNKADHVLQDITVNIDSKSSNKKCDNSDSLLKNGKTCPRRQINFDNISEVLTS